jgi:hypothetical protein
VRQCGKIYTAGQATEDNMAQAHWMQDNQGYRHTLRTCNNYCFCSVTMVARTRLNVTSYVHWVSCCKLSSDFLIKSWPSA